MARRKHRNVYAGPDSTAKLPVRGKVDEPWEILELAYATAVDAVNEKMLSRTPGRFKKTTAGLVHGRFWILRRLADKHKWLLPILSNIEKLTLDYVEDRIPLPVFLQNLDSYFLRLGFSPRFLDLVKLKIMHAERRSR